MRFRILFSLLILAFLPQSGLSKDWRGIVPLKSTRRDVERRFGKPDKWGDYVFKGERVSFDYGQGSCKGLYLILGKDNCKCLADEDAVMSIFVEPTVKTRISDLNLDLKKFTRTPIAPFPQTFEYHNPEEGLVYTVDESEDEIMHITYYPSTFDCQDIISKRTPKSRNSWRGLVPLHSTRKDLERLFGSANRDGATLVSYRSNHETIVATYSDGKCDSSSSDWNVPKNTLIELIVNPNPSFLLKELHLDSSRYERSEIFLNPQLDNSTRAWNYVDTINGILIRTQLTRDGGEESVVSISYLPARGDVKLRCR